jgi:hypothetical protein
VNSWRRQPETIGERAVRRQAAKTVAFMLDTKGKIRNCELV